jgi:hypothetical protein
MMDERQSLEDELTSALGRAAAQAPAPPEDLVDRVGAGLRRRRYRRRGQAAGAAIAIVAIAGTTVAVPRLLPGAAEPGNGVAGQPADPPTGRQGADSVELPGFPGIPRPTTITPRPVAVERLWPGAVRRIPNRPAGKGGYKVDGVVDKNTLLVSTRYDPERSFDLALYDITTQKITPLTKVVTPRRVEQSTNYYAADFVVGDGHVGWSMGYQKNGKSLIDIWTVSVRGGAAKKAVTTEIPEQKDEGGIRLALADGKVFWSPEGSGGIYQAPITGGNSQLFPGVDTRGHHLLEWPWVGRPAPGSESTGNAYELIRNLNTGEVRRARLPKGVNWACGPTWCTGRAARPTGAGVATLRINGYGGIALQRRDGSGRRLLPHTFNEGPSSSEMIPEFDRFLEFMALPDDPSLPPLQDENIPPRRMLYDLETGKSARLPDPPANWDVEYVYSVFGSATYPLYIWPIEDGYLVVDLSAVN